MDVRVRYAPSPTGLQHIGGVRTALFNYFFARKNGGKFILRIEDTDRERYSDESLEDLYSTLKFLNIEWDEGPIVGGAYGPYIQSERLKRYQDAAHELVRLKKAYYCFCSEERLQALKAEQEASKSQYQGYDRLCSHISYEEALKRVQNGEKYVIRLSIPESGESSFDDIILGHIKRKNKDVTPDPIILKSDGYPTYHLANVIDDHDMKITHIMRAQEWVASTPLHQLIYKAFGWEAPLYAHLPMVMGNDGQKLSKRHGSTSVRDFIKSGYLSEAITNYIMLVGWSYDDKREFFSKQDLEQLFDINKIHSSPAIFDYKKLDWFNGQYIRKLSDEELALKLVPYLKDEFKNDDNNTICKKVYSYVPLIKERLKKLSDCKEMLIFFFKEPVYSLKEIFIPKNSNIQDSIKYLEIAKQALQKEDNPEEYLSIYATNNNIKLNNIFMPLRVAVTGSTVSPPLFMCIDHLGKEKTIKRVQDAINFLK